MKDLVRMRSALRENVEQALNQQIQMEFVSSATYLAMASWCDRNGFDYCADFFYKQADEERGHGLKILHYINDVGGSAYSPEVPSVSQDFPSLRAVFEATLEQEIAVSDSINRLLALARRENDFATEELMRWYVKEQLEEEYIARRCLELFDQIPADQVHYLDKQLSKVTYQNNPLEDE